MRPAINWTFADDPPASTAVRCRFVLAMDISDRWIGEGCELGSPLIAEERAALVRSYAALLSAVHRP